MAQESYDLCTIIYQHSNERDDFLTLSGSRSFLAISQAGKEFEKIDIKLKRGDNQLDTKPLLNKVKEYVDNGWEVINFTVGQSNWGLVHYAYLKRKIKA